VNPYTFRHSFGTWAAGVLKDDRALMELMRTRSIRRYTEGATAQRLEQAREQLVEASRRRA
jgi:integrase